MTLFTYKAINNLGKNISGDIEADSKEHAMELVSLKGYIPESIKKKVAGKGNNAIFNISEQLLPSVKSKDLLLYTMQLKTLLQSGISILQIFQILEAQTENKTLRNTTIDIKESVREGSSLYEAFSRHQNIFSNLYCILLKAGEMSGALPSILERLIYILEHEEKVRSDIKAAVRYPLIVVCFLTVAFFVLLTFVIPKFITLFESAGLDLPLPTKICMLLYLFLQNYWLYALLTIIITTIGLIQFVKTEKGGFIKDALLLRFPLIGSLLVKSAMSRFASIFSILQSSGIPVLDALKIIGSTLGNKAILKEFEKINELLSEGRGIATPLRQAKFFPPMVVNLVAIGEESGNLDNMLQEIARHYDVEVEYATKKFSDAIGPVLVVGLAAVVGFFAFAIFLPMWDLTKMVN